MCNMTTDNDRVRIEMSDSLRPPPGLVKFAVDRPGLSVAAARLHNVRVVPSTDEFAAYERELFAEIRRKHTLEGLAENRIIRSFRDLYWSFGMDPTKLRVSSEALARRVLRGENLWRINNVVDVINLASAYHLLPISLVDEQRMRGGLVVRTANRGEIFTRIGGKTMTCRGREIVVADDERIVCFGYATHDSHHTRVTEDSTDILVLVYGTPEVRAGEMSDAVGITLDMIRRWVDCKTSSPRIYSIPQ